MADTLPIRGQIPAWQLDKLEWLSLEAVWASVKAPYQSQWERWQRFPDITDPANSIGIVIGNNLARINFDVNEAYDLEPNDPSRLQLFSRATNQIGKLASGLISIASFMQAPEYTWRRSLDEDQIAAHVDFVASALKTAQNYGEIWFSPDTYYDKLETVGQEMKEMGDVPDPEVMIKQSDVVAKVIPKSIKTWNYFIGIHRMMVLEPGGTSRSSGPQIDRLQSEFREFIPTIREAVVARQQEESARKLRHYHPQELRKQRI